MGAPAGHVWAHYSPTNVWSSRWCLFNEYGEKVFTLLFQPRSTGFLHPDSALFEVSNEWLYHGLGITGVMGLLRECVDYDVVGISRVDLAVDFNPTTMQEKVIRGLAENRYYVGGKRSGSGFWENISNAALAPRWQGKTPHCQSWGHKTSDVRWKLYYKSHELKEGIGQKVGWNKPYIVDMWNEIGMDITDVWRLEVAIHNANCFKYMDEKLTFERFMKSTPDLFKALYTDRFSVHENQGHKDRSNDRLVDFLPVGHCHGAFRVRRREVEVEHNGSLSLLRHLVSDIMTEQVLLNEPVRESLLQTIGVIIERDGLGRYFRSMVNDEYDSWCEWVRVQAYYYGQEHVKETGYSGTSMDTALLESGLITDHWSGEQQGLFLSALNPERLNDNQLKIAFQ